MEESDQRVAVQLAVVVSDIARRDWPGSWDQLFNSLMATLHTGTDLAISRAVYTLHRVLKELSTKRLSKDRQAFAALSMQLFPVISAAWLERSGQLVQALGGWGAMSLGDEARTNAACEEGLEPLANLVLFLVKCLYRIVLSGFPNSMGADGVGISPPDLAALFQNLLQHEHAIAAVAITRAAADLKHPSSSVAREEKNFTRPLPHKLSKLLYRMTLIPLEAQKQSPLPFRPFLGPFLNAFYDQLSSLYAGLPPPPETLVGTDTFNTYPCEPATSPPSFERLAINALSFLTNVLACDEYKAENVAFLTTSSSTRGLSATGDQEMTAQAVAEACAAVADFFSGERAQALLDMALHRILPLRKPDLEEWEADAEILYLTCDSVTAEESPRAATEPLVQALLERRSDVLVPLLAGLLQDSPGQLAAAGTEAALVAAGAAASNGSPASGVTTDMCLWEARYLAAGLCVGSLRGAVDFNAWFISTLAPALTALVQPSQSGGGGGPGEGALPVLRRRILWLIGMWMGEVRDDIRPPLYQSLVQMLAVTGATTAASSTNLPAPDAAVSLSLIKTLGKCVDSWDFNVEAFRPLTGSAVSGLYSVLECFDELDSQLQSMNLIHLILRAVGVEGVRLCVDAVISPLGDLWQGGENYDACLMRKCVLSIVTVVVGAVGSAESARLHSIALPMVHVATALGTPESDVLMEDGLELWSTVVAQAPEYNAELHSLFAHLPPIIARDLEHLRVVLKLVEQYTVLGAGPFLEAHATGVTQLFNSTVTEVSARGAVCVAEALETVLMRFPSQGADMLRQGGVLTKLLVFAVESDADDRGGAEGGGGGGGIGGAPSRSDDTTVKPQLGGKKVV
jgi:hypothetical protein